jgi:hypothetical protein
MSGKLTPEDVAELEAKKQEEKRKALELRKAHSEEEKKNSSGNKNTGE